MILLHQQGFGSPEVCLTGRVPTPREEMIKRNAARYLKAEFAAPGTIEMLEQLPFEVWHARNGFGDEFDVLYMMVGMQTYVEIENQVGIWRQRVVDGCPAIARAFEKTGNPIRFVAVELDLDEDVANVASPTLTVTSDIVEEALRNAQTLIESHGAASGLDRVHTAFHGYLLAACDRAGITAKQDAPVTDLFARLRENHPGLSIGDVDAKPKIDQVMRGMSRIVDALDPLRNKKSLAHPHKPLDHPEAMLAINLIRSMLRYLDSRLR